LCFFIDNIDRYDIMEKLYVMLCLIPISHPSRIRLHGLVTVLSCWKEEKTDEKMYYIPFQMLFLSHV